MAVACEGCKGSSQSELGIDFVVIAPTQSEDIEVSGHCCRGLQQGRLACSGLSPQHDATTTSSSGRTNKAGNVRELYLATDKSFVKSLTFAPAACGEAGSAVRR
jgi:hypothetical protein